MEIGSGEGFFVHIFMSAMQEIGITALGYMHFPMIFNTTDSQHLSIEQQSNASMLLFEHINRNNMVGSILPIIGMYTVYSTVHST